MGQTRMWNRWRGWDRAADLEARLSALAAAGKRLDSAGLLLCFTDDAPRQAVFAVTCPPLRREADAADRPEAWAAAGWEPVCPMGSRMIYARSGPDAVRPDAAPAARLAMLQRAAAFRGLGGWAWLAFLAAVLGLLVWSGLRDPVAVLSSVPALLQGPVWLAVTVLVAVCKARDGRWRRRAAAAVAAGRDCPPLPRQQGLMTAALVLTIVMAVLLVLQRARDVGLPQAVYLVCLFLVILIAPSRGGPAKHRAARWAGVALLAAAALSTVWWPAPAPEAVPAERLAVSAADVGLPDIGPRTWQERRASPLLTWETGGQSGPAAYFRYELCRCAVPALEPVCRRQLAEGGSWQPVSDGVWLWETPWGRSYLLAGGGAAAVVTTNAEPPLDGGQLEAAAAALGIVPR